jgi:hypothetical protein
MRKTYGFKNVIFGGVDSSDDQPMFWSNDDGWVDLSNATLFSDEEKARFDLPLYAPTKTDTASVWVTLPSPSRMETINVLG